MEKEGLPQKKTGPGPQVAKGCGQLHFVVSQLFATRDAMTIMWWLTVTTIVSEQGRLVNVHDAKTVQKLPVLSPLKISKDTSQSFVDIDKRPSRNTQAYLNEGKIP